MTRPDTDERTELRGLIGKGIVGAVVETGSDTVTSCETGSVTITLDTGEVLTITMDCGPAHHEMVVSMNGVELART